MTKRRKPDPMPERVVDFARHYVQMVEALLREGVPEATAREEARMAATTLLVSGSPMPGGGGETVCPLCGRSPE